MLNLLIFGFLSLAVSFITGMEFSMSTRLRSGRISNSQAKNYASEMFGAALGVVVTSVFLIPLAGVEGSCFVLVMMNLVSAGFLQSHRKNIVSL